jgi:ABC-type phosphate/phosphonate transport system substrate-binding protein
MKTHVVAIALLVGCLAGAPLHAGEPPLRVGLPDSLFRDVPKSALPIVAAPLTQMLLTQTGLHGRCQPVGGAGELGRQLEAGNVQLGVFSGIEFAWVRLERPHLMPLVIGVNKQRFPRAYLVGRSDNPAVDLAAFKGKKLALPYFTREHCRVVVERCCPQADGKNGGEFFAQVTRPANLERAMDDVVWGRVDLAVVDDAALVWYKEQKPGCYRWLKVVHESPRFPAPVIAYQPTKVDRVTVERLRAALTGARSTAEGRDLLATFRLTAFERVPTDYEKVLADIVKVYPRPAPAEGHIAASATAAVRP